MGIIPRAATAIFEQLGDEKYVEKKVSVSYLEIYNEELVRGVCWLLFVSCPSKHNKITSLDIAQNDLQLDGCSNGAAKPQARSDRSSTASAKCSARRSGLQSEHSLPRFASEIQTSES